MKWIGFVIAIFVAAVAAYMVLKFSGDTADKPQEVQVSDRSAPQVEAVNVYVASRFIPIGSVLEENMLTVQPWPKHLVLDGFVVGSEKGQQLIGKVTRAPFQAQSPIINNNVVNPEDPNFLAGDLPKGMRVVTIKTNEIDGVAGFVFPGDRVDVIINHKIMKEGTTVSDLEEKSERELQEAVSETMLSNVRVLAVDQRATAGVNEDGGIIIPKSISLEVTPEDAQRIVLARELGELSLSLRSIQDKDTIETVAITRQPDLSQFDVSSIEMNRKAYAPVRVIRGTELETTEREDTGSADSGELVEE